MSFGGLLQERRLELPGSTSTASCCGSTSECQGRTTLPDGVSISPRGRFSCVASTRAARSDSLARCSWLDSVAAGMRCAASRAFFVASPVRTQRWSSQARIISRNLASRLVREVARDRPCASRQRAPSLSHGRCCRPGPKFLSTLRLSIGIDRSTMEKMKPPPPMNPNVRLRRTNPNALQIVSYREGATGGIVRLSSRSSRAEFSQSPIRLFDPISHPIPPLA